MGSRRFLNISQATHADFWRLVYKVTHADFGDIFYKTSHADFFWLVFLDEDIPPTPIFGDDLVQKNQCGSGSEQRRFCRVLDSSSRKLKILKSGISRRRVKNGHFQCRRGGQPHRFSCTRSSPKISVGGMSSSKKTSKFDQKSVLVGYWRTPIFFDFRATNADFILVYQATNADFFLVYQATNADFSCIIPSHPHHPRRFLDPNVWCFVNRATHFFFEFPFFRVIYFGICAV